MIGQDPALKKTVHIVFRKAIFGHMLKLTLSVSSTVGESSMRASKMTRTESKGIPNEQQQNK